MKRISTKNKGIAFGVLAIALLAAGSTMLHDSVHIKHQARQTLLMARSISMRNAHEMVVADQLKKKLTGQPLSMAAPLSQLVPVSVQNINRTSEAFGVKIYRFDVNAKVFGGQYNAMGITLRNMGKPIPGYPGIKGQEINIKGEWKTLDGFHQWVDYMKYIGLAIPHISMTGQHFEMDVEVIGL
ncbi:MULTISPECIES: hypothetical protein [Acidithiobacillus]|jgi:hypothetical protein|uniref:hypothetical protein n=1 Tax=Acidithiobacillus TaxID=119977 RepID=UPI0004E22962|nr:MULTISPECIES: hypothetical protein [Acidithiobacillus]MDD2750011.1 hypothetical protein [Acidithiobacillus sp.]MDD5278657.1 hypothetical protein [Acidithiobacillus sp.]